VFRIAALVGRSPRDRRNYRIVALVGRSETSSPRDRRNYRGYLIASSQARTASTAAVT
jgi:hypothetical protein